MQMPVQFELAVEDRSGVGEARREAARLAATLDFGEAEAGALALVVTEAATNILKHAGGGQLIFRVVQRGSTGGIEVLALDRGPGLANLAQAFRDGHSTAGSSGTGLGALQRMSAEVHVHSTPNKGVVLRAVVWAKSVPVGEAEGPVVGVICLPKAGETVGGDAWTVMSGHDGFLICVVDGLGHGPEAAMAARAGIASVTEGATRAHSVTELVERAHLAMRPTRGAALAVARVTPEKAICNFCGVGNISACLLSRGQSRSLVSTAGILGHQIHRIKEFQYPFSEDTLFIMHSDGLATRWRLDDYPGLERSHPALVAGVLYRDYSRQRDDTVVCAVRGAIGRG
jgi:anti-sigma regulatory factor (Ser/Thr protein kinase)